MCYDFRLIEHVGCRQLEYSAFSSHFRRVSHYAWSSFIVIIQDDSTRKVLGWNDEMFKFTAVERAREHEHRSERADLKREHFKHRLQRAQRDSDSGSLLINCSDSGDTITLNLERSKRRCRAGLVVHDMAALSRFKRMQ